MSLTGKPQLTASAPLGNDGFWPDLDLADLLERYRVPGEYPGETINWALMLAMVRINAALSPAQALMLAAGHATLTDYLATTPATINNTATLLVQYQHAVFSRARALLVRQFNQPGPGQKPRSGQSGTSADADDTELHWLDESAAAVAAINLALDPDAPTTSNHGVYVSSL